MTDGLREPRRTLEREVLDVYLVRRRGLCVGEREKIPVDEVNMDPVPIL